MHMTSIHTSLMLGHLPLYHVLAFWCFVYVAWFIFETELRECYIYTHICIVKRLQIDIALVILILVVLQKFRP